MTLFREVKSIYRQAFRFQSPSDPCYFGENVFGSVVSLIMKNNIQISVTQNYNISINPKIMNNVATGKAHRFDGVADILFKVNSKNKAEN